MTTSQIASAMFRSKSTVEKWVRKTCAESAQVAEKVMVAHHIKVKADFTIDEACLIVEHGMGVGAAAMFRKLTLPNDHGEPMTNGKVGNDYVTRTELIEFMSPLMAGINKLLQIGMPSPVQQLQISTDYFTIKGHCNNMGMKQGMGDMMKLGKECARLSREIGIEVHKVADEQFGRLNSYHIDILKEVFAI